MTIDARLFPRLLVRPEIAFALIWGLVFALYSWDIVDFFPPAQWPVLLMVGGSLVIALAFALLWGHLARTWPAHDPATVLPDSIRMRSMVYALLALWLAGFAFIVIRSDGVPFYWYLADIPRTYVEYGVPTFSGAWNTLRVVIAILAVFCLMQRPRFDWAMIAVVGFLTFTVALEVNRGGLVLFALNVVAAGILAAPTLRRQLIWALAIMAIVLGGISVMGGVRANTAQLAAEVEGGFAPEGGEPATGLRLAVSRSQVGAWAYLYLTTPVANLHNAAIGTLSPPPYPGFHTLYPMLPSIIRPDLPSEQRYPLPLLQPGYTMTTGYGPFVVDFGFVGASIAMGLQLAVGGLIFVLSRRYLWALILAPMFFATQALSFFTNYFFTLLMPFHAALAIALALLLVHGRAVGYKLRAAS